jgi:hypothetical protein
MSVVRSARAMTTAELLVHDALADVIACDPRNAGVVARAVTEPAGDSGRHLVVDMIDLADGKSRLDVFRVLLMLASDQKDSDHDTVVLACRGEPRFTIRGEVFRALGRDYETKHAMVLLRGFSGLLRDMDGAPAYPEWTGGFLTVALQEIREFRDAHQRWYCETLRHGSSAAEGDDA